MSFSTKLKKNQDCTVLSYKSIQSCYAKVYSFLDADYQCFINVYSYAILYDLCVRIKSIR